MAAQFIIAAAMEMSNTADYTVPRVSLSNNRSTSKRSGSKTDDPRYEHLIKLESGRVRCGLCNSTYSCLISARAHTVRVHEQPEYFECSLCSRIFRTKLNFRSHLNLSHGIKGSNLVAKYGRLVDMMDEYVESSDMLTE